MAGELTPDSIREQQPETIPVRINGEVVHARILKYDDQNETTIQIGDDLFGTTWVDIADALNADQPLEITPNPYHFQMRS